MSVSVLPTRVGRVSAPATCNRPGAWPNPTRGADMGKRSCSIEGCECRIRTQGLCQTHYRRQVRGADVLAPLKPSLEQSFWARVDKRGPDDCWLWTGTITEKGYGRLQHEGRQHRAHRLSYELHNGPIPAEMFACHSCDNPPCVNPAHLWAGTNADNQRDLHTKGLRSFAGEGNLARKLSLAQVQEIRRRAASGEPPATLAREMGVSVSNVYAIVRGRSWTASYLAG